MERFKLEVKHVERHGGCCRDGAVKQPNGRRERRNAEYAGHEQASASGATDHHDKQRRAYGSERHG